MPSLPTPSERYPAAFQFLGAYLHQGWDLEHTTADAAVDSAIRDFGESDELSAVERELADIAAADDVTIETVLGAICCYYPPGDGLTYREWLNRVLRRVRGVV